MPECGQQTGSWVEARASWEVAPGIFALRLSAPAIAARARAGQFVHLRLSEGLDPLLRRPLSIGPVEGDEVRLLYRIVGQGTRRLSECKPGDRFHALGPLGNPFRLHPERPALLIAGGLGIAVFPLLAGQLLEAGCKDIHLSYGARSACELVWREYFAESGIPITAATDDGSEGHHGTCTQCLSDVLRRLPAPPAVYACGPEPMFRAILRAIPDRDLPMQFSYEQRMGCGFGACLACAVETRDGYVRACKEGPVLDASLFRKD